MVVGSHASESHPREHIVQFYDHDVELVSAVARFLSDGLDAGDGCIVVATDHHRTLIDATLAVTGVDVVELTVQRRYVCLEARDLLSTFRSADGQLSYEQFHLIVGGLIADVARSHRSVRVFGEMVALLWEAGDVTAAAQLEEFWNALAEEQEFTLWCGYPTAEFANGHNLPATKAVCDAHARLVAPAAYSQPATPVVGAAGSDPGMFFLPVMSAPRAARAYIRSVMHALGERLVAEAELIGSELATNAVMHGSSPFVVSIKRTATNIRLAVTDVSRAHPLPRQRSLARPGGLGFAVINALATRWGSEPHEHGKVVWAELPISAAGSAAAPASSAARPVHRDGRQATP